MIGKSKSFKNVIWVHILLHKVLVYRSLFVLLKSNIHMLIYICSSMDSKSDVGIYKLCYIRYTCYSSELGLDLTETADLQKQIHLKEQ